MSEGVTVGASSIIPVAVAIGVFGVIYGAAAAEIMGPAPAIISSVVVFSGAAQFSLVGLLASGASAATVLGVVTILALRHLPLGAVLRPLLDGGSVSRTGQAWFLVDETAGLAIASGGPASRTLVVAGTAAYLAWIGGTVLGVLGADLGDVESLAVVVFPVLFVGLAALTSRSAADVRRTLLAGGASLALLTIWPEGGALGCMAVAVAVCLPGRTG